MAAWEESAMFITWMMNASQGSSIRTIDNSSQERRAPHSATLQFMDAGVISKLAQLTQTIRKIDRGLAGDGQ